MPSTAHGPSSGRSEDDRGDIDRCSSPQRVTRTAAEQNSASKQEAHRLTNIASTMSNLDVADNVFPFKTSADQEVNSTSFDSDLRKSPSAILTEDTIIHVPGRGDVVAGSSDRYWASSSSPVGRDASANATIGKPSAGDIAHSRSKRQKGPADTRHKRVRVNGGTIESTTDAESSRTKIDLVEDQRGDKNLGHGDLPYRSYRCLNLPERFNPQEPPVQGDPSTYYGTMTYDQSIITYWCDQRGFSYKKTMEIVDNSTNHETLRQSHVKALREQYEKYGLKENDDIPEPTHRAMHRGKKRAGRKSGPKTAVNDQSDPRINVFPAIGSLSPTMVQYITGPTQKGAEKALPIYVSEAPFRQLESTAIVICKDLFNMEFSEIRKLMETSYNFSMSATEVESYYHAARPVTYGSRYHGYSSVDGRLDPELLSEKNEIRAAAEALMALSRHGMADAQSQQGNRQQQPPVKIWQTMKDGKARVVVEPVVERTATSTISSADVEAAKTLLLFSKQGVEFGDNS